MFNGNDLGNAIDALFVFACIGLFALAAGLVALPFGVWWLIKHVSISLH